MEPVLPAAIPVEALAPIVGSALMHVLDAVKAWYMSGELSVKAATYEQILANVPGVDRAHIVDRIEAYLPERVAGMVILWAHDEAGLRWTWDAVAPSSLMAAATPIHVPGAASSTWASRVTH